MRIGPDFDPRRKQIVTYGAFTVHHDPLVHRPWGLYRVYRGSKYIGAQISYPSLEDCRYLTAHRNDDRHIGERVGVFLYTPEYGEFAPRRRGRPTKSDSMREFLEACRA